MKLGDVIVVLFGKTEWVVEVIEISDATFVVDRIQPAVRCRLDRAQFGKYVTREGDTTWFRLTDIIAQ